MLTIIREGTEGGNAQHIAQHFLSFEDVETVLIAPIAKLCRRSSNRPMWLSYNEPQRLPNAIGFKPHWQRPTLNRNALAAIRSLTNCKLQPISIPLWIC